MVHLYRSTRHLIGCTPTCRRENRRRKIWEGVWYTPSYPGTTPGCLGHTRVVDIGRPGGVSGYPRAWYRSVS